MRMRLMVGRMLLLRLLLREAGDDTADSGPMEEGRHHCCICAGDGWHLVLPAAGSQCSATCCACGDDGAGEDDHCGEGGCGAFGQCGEESGDDVGAARSDAADGGDAGSGVAGVLGDGTKYFFGEFGASGYS